MRPIDAFFPACLFIKGLKKLMEREKTIMAISIFYTEVASIRAFEVLKNVTIEDITVAQKTAPMFEHISNFQLLCDHDISCCYKKY